MRVFGVVCVRELYMIILQIIFVAFHIFCCAVVHSDTTFNECALYF